MTKQTIEEWNEDPWHRADWEVETSLFYWILGLISFGIIKEIVFRYKLKKYDQIYLEDTLFIL